MGISLFFILFVPKDGTNVHFRFFFSIYMCVATVLFVLLCVVVTTILRIISKQMKTIDNNESASGRMDQWQQCYYFLSESIQQINSCFGLVILMFYIFIFIRMINGCYTVVTEIRKTDPNFAEIFGPLLTILWPLLGFVLVSYGPYQIKQEVISFKI